MKTCAGSVIAIVLSLFLSLATASAEVVELTLMTNHTPTQVEEFLGFIADYEARNPGVKIKPGFRRVTFEKMATDKGKVPPHGEFISW